MFADFFMITQFPFTRRATKLDYYHQKMSCSRFSKLLKTQDFRKLRNQRKSLICLEFIKNIQLTNQEKHFDSCVRKLQKFSCKKFDRKNYFTKFCEFGYNILFKVVISASVTWNKLHSLNFSTKNMYKGNNANMACQLVHQSR